MIIRKHGIIPLVIVIILALSSPVVYAYPKEGSSPQKKTSSGEREARRQALYRELNVNDEQKRLLEENRKRHKEEAGAMFDEMKKKRSLMKEELHKDGLDMAKIGEINNELKQLQARMLDHRLDRILEVRKILTPEQFKKFLAKTGQRKGYFKNR